MSFESFLEKLTTPKSPDNVLVCEASFNSLKAAVVEKKGQKLVVGSEVVSEQVDLNDAVQEVIERAQRLGWKGKHAIVTSPAVCLAMLDLNIPAKNKLPIEQVEESVQWEFEPVYNQHKAMVSIGQMMLLSGLLNTEQVDEIIAAQNELINSKNSAVVYKQFGELALDLGFINRKQLDDMLTRQRWFVSDSDSLKCGWRAYEPQADAEPQEHQWLVSGIKLDVLRAWQAAFIQHGVALEAIYPIAGVGDIQFDSDLAPQKLNEKEVLLEVHQGAVATISLSNGVPIQIQSLPSSEEVLLAKAVELVSLLPEESDVPIKLIDCVSKTEVQHEQLTSDIKTVSNRDIEVDNFQSRKISVAMRNAVRSLLKVQPNGYVVAVSVHKALPRLMERTSVRAVLMCFLLVVLIGLSELALLGSRLWIKTNIASISQDVNRIKQEKKRINTKISAVNKLNAEIEKKEGEKKNNATMIALLTKDLPERNQRLSELMERLQESITQDILVDAILEDTLLGFNFRVWALSEQSAQSFVKKFQLAIHPMNYRIKNLTVKEQTGRLGLIGYAVNFSITPYSEKEWQLRQKRKQARPY